MTTYYLNRFRGIINITLFNKEGDHNMKEDLIKLISEISNPGTIAIIYHFVNTLIKKDLP